MLALRNWFREDPYAALDWARQQRDPRIQTVAWSAISLNMAPAEAIRLTETLSPDLRKRVIERLLSEQVIRSSDAWQGDDLPEVGNSIAKFPEGPEKNHYLELLMGQWDESGGDGAQQWLDSLPSRTYEKLRRK